MFLKKAHLFILIAPLVLNACDSSGGSGSGSGGGTGGDLTVTTMAGTNGSITPSSAQVPDGDTTSFTINPDSGFVIGSVDGCGGTLVGTTYTTDPIISDCEVTATFVTQNSTSITQSIYIKASNTDGSDVFGTSAALNEDGTVLVVGAPSEQSANGLQDDNSRPGGAVYVYTKDTSGWSQQSYVKPSNMPQPFMSPSLRLAFGDSVAVNDDGTTIAVAAPGEVQASAERGGVYIFDLIGGIWVEQILLKTVNSDSYASRSGAEGPVVALDGTGDTLVVGEFGDSSATTVINGDEMDDSVNGAGAAHVYFRSSTGWVREAYLKGSGLQSADWFGASVAISGDGNTVAIGAVEIGVGSGSGSVYVFIRTAGIWTEQQRIQPAATTSQFGFSVSLNESGDILAVGVVGDSSTGSGIDTDPSTCCTVGSGSAYVFERSGGSWSQQAYLKSGNPDINDQFGRTISINSTGNKLIVGAIGESGNSAGINADPNNNLAVISGAAYVFSRTGTVWKQDAYLKSANPIEFREFGNVVSISGDGATVAVGGAKEASNATGINGDTTNVDLPAAGAVYVFD